MSILTAGNTVYTRPVAKVMISMPDQLLERLDRRVVEAGETRSGFIQRVVEGELDAWASRRREELEEILGPPIHMDLDAAQMIREDRESH